MSGTVLNSKFIILLFETIAVIIIVWDFLNKILLDLLGHLEYFVVLFNNFSLGMKQSIK